MDWLFQTTDSLSYVFLRFGLAVTFFFHGTQHAFGWHGGKGMKDQVANWRNKYHIPVAIGMFGTFVELFTVISMALALVFGGAGAFSIDRMISR